MKYTIGIQVNAGNVVPKFGEFINSVNNAMSGFGFDEKLLVRARILECSIDVARELTPEEKAKVETLIIKSIVETQPTWEPKIVDWKLDI